MSKIMSQVEVYVEAERRRGEAIVQQPIRNGPLLFVYTHFLEIFSGLRELT